MRIVWKSTILCLVLTVSVWCGRLLADRNTLSKELIRLHVVANSDHREDQNIKLQVRDAILASIDQDLSQIADVSAAKAYLQENLPKIESAANQALALAGFDGHAVATLCREAFQTRHYETFSLPAGIYDTLRITIGEGQGQNWWCVAYPTLCLPATAAGFSDVAASAGFSSSLRDTLTGETGYTVRFFLLDALGQLQNNLFLE